MQQGTTHHIFVVNPNAGRRKEQEKLRAQIEQACAEKQASFEIYETRWRGDGADFMGRKTAAFLAENRENELCFYFCGGDGSVMEAVGGFCALPEEARDGRVRIGVVPVGTGNDFIRNFGKAEDFLDIRRQLNGSGIRVDAMAFQDRFAANMFNIGFDCQVVKKVNALRGNFFMRKGLAYPIGVAYTLIRNPHTQLRVTFDDGEVREGRFLLTFIANGCYCGGGFRSASKADQHDGLLDVMLVNPMTRLRFLSMVGRYKKGTLLGTPFAEKNIYYKQCRSVTLEHPDGTDVCIDGEVEPFGRITIRALQDAVYFSVPSSAASVRSGSLS